MKGKKSVYPQCTVAAAVYFQPPVARVQGLKLAQSVAKGKSIRLYKAYRKFGH